MHLIAKLAGALLLTSAAFAATAVVTLDSSRDGQSIAAGAPVDWTIRVSLSAGDNAGLALFTADLVQDGANPAFVDIPPADAASDDGVPMQYFSRPLGISNPATGTGNFGYLGSQRSPAGQTYKNLLQIGGAQNTFGVAGPAGLGQFVNVVTGVAQSGPQTIATGSITAPSAAGIYRLRLENVRVNVLDQRFAPPQFSPVSAAAADLAGAEIQFTVGGVTGVPGDSNCDSEVNFLDIDYFVAALISEQSWRDLYAAQHGGAAPPCPFANNDVNGDSTVDFDDIDPFVACLVAGGCP